VTLEKNGISLDEAKSAAKAVHAVDPSELNKLVDE